MSSQSSDRERIFRAAAELAQPGQRAAFLDVACGDDSQLRAEIEVLLRQDEQTGSFLDKPAFVASGEQTREFITESPGTTIGPYKLLQQIGEGGFGVVFLAEQKAPIRRKVALKIVKPGMDSRAVIARFEAERQALALMDHPHIAKVIDGGTTDTGRPYFVMEVVHGVSITEYCDKERFDTRSRLNLFMDVCHAIQHAHQKGIIHRDLKPSNVMVTLHDGQPVVKVIDFGVAKALHQQLTEKTLFTRYGQMIGTPQYMSPEQAEMSGLDVDTRSDIYSLGVLLYELLTGSPPLTMEQLQKAGYKGMRRMICEEEFVKPSTRLSSAVEQQLVDIAEQRSASPEDLQKQLRRDLDWIVMKALDKDRSLRYESPTAFSNDVLRYLKSEPIEARKPTVAYWVQKFVRRNRMLVASVAVVVTALSVGFAVALFSLVELRATVSDLGDSLRAQGLQHVLSGDTDRGNETIEQLQQIGKPEYVLQLRGLQYNLAGEFEATVGLLQPYSARYPDSVGIHTVLAMGYLGQGDLTRWIQMLPRLEELQPQTSEDKLLVTHGYLHYFDPLRGQQYLTESWQERRLPLTLLVRARTGVEAAIQTGQNRYLAEHLRDIEAGTRVLGTRSAGGTTAFVASVLGAYATPNSHAELRKRFALQASSLFDELEKGEVNLAPTLAYRAKLAYLQEPTAALEFYRQITPRPHADYWLCHRFALEFELGTGVSPRNVVGSRSLGVYCDWAQAINLIDQGDRNGATRLARQLFNRHEQPDSDLVALAILELANASEEATLLAGKSLEYWSKETRRTERWSQWLRENLVAYYVDRDEQRLIENARKSPYVRRYLTFAHGELGDHYLGLGDNERAAEHYRAVLEQGCVHFGDYVWSRAFLTRLESGWRLLGDPISRVALKR